MFLTSKIIKYLKTFLRMRGKILFWQHWRFFFNKEGLPLRSATQPLTALTLSLFAHSSYSVVIVQSQSRVDPNLVPY